MKAISLRPEWALKVLSGTKTVECRTWKTPYRGDLLICSSAAKKKGTIPGHALIVYELIDIVPFEKQHLKDACMDDMPDKPSYAWILDNPKDIIPFPVKGKLHLYDVDDNLIQYLSDLTDAEANAAYRKHFAPLFV